MVKKILFVCYTNINRSPTAARVFSELLEEKGYLVFGRGVYTEHEFEVTSAGVYAYDEGNEITDEQLANANQIFFMDNYVYSEAKRLYKIEEEKSVVFDIKDIYFRNSSILEEILRKKLKDFVP